jgi:hypothetical protein
VFNDLSTICRYIVAVICIDGGNRVPRENHEMQKAKLYPIRLYRLPLVVSRVRSHNFNVIGTDCRGHDGPAKIDDVIYIRNRRIRKSN